MRTALNVLTIALLLAGCNEPPSHSTYEDARADTLHKSETVGVFKTLNWWNQTEDIIVSDVEGRTIHQMPGSRYQVLVTPTGRKLVMGSSVVTQTSEQENGLYFFTSSGSRIYKYDATEDRLVRHTSFSHNWTSDYAFVSGRIATVFTDQDGTRRLHSLWVFTGNGQWIQKEPTGLDWCTGQSMNHSVFVEAQGVTWAGFETCYVTYTIATDTWQVYKAAGPRHSKAYSKALHALDPRSLDNNPPKAIEVQ